MRANAQRAHSYCAQACTGAHTWTCTRVHTRASHTCTPHALWVVTEAREAPLWGGGWGPGERPEGSPLGPREQVPPRVVPGQRSWERMSQGPGLSCHLLGQGRWRGGRGGERGRGGGGGGSDCRQRGATQPGWASVGPTRRGSPAGLRVQTEAGWPSAGAETEGLGTFKGPHLPGSSARSLGGGLQPLSGGPSPSAGLGFPSTLSEGETAAGTQQRQ